jgi:hypothetical protein
MSIPVISEQPADYAGVVTALNAAGHRTETDGHSYLVGAVVEVPHPSDMEHLTVFITSPHDCALEGIGDAQGTVWNVSVQGEIGGVHVMSSVDVALEGNAIRLALAILSPGLTLAQRFSIADLAQIAARPDGVLDLP